MMSHTPGPWDVMTTEDHQDYSVVRHMNHGYRLLAEVQSCEDDAALMAAAPDLLAALEGIMEYQHTQQVRQPYAVMMPEYEELFLAALAAIKKARGEE